MLTWAKPNITEEIKSTENSDLFSFIRPASKLWIRPRNKISSGKPVNRKIPNKIIGNCQNGCNSAVWRINEVENPIGIAKKAINNPK